MEVEVRDLKALPSSDSGAKHIGFSGLRARKINKTTRGLVGTVEVVSSELDNESNLDVEIYMKQGGEYRKLPYNLPPRPTCDIISQDVLNYPEMVKVSDLPHPVPCPLPMVKNFEIFYRIKNLNIEFSGNLYDKRLCPNAKKCSDAFVSKR
jgi:hypothetical protein